MSNPPLISPIFRTNPDTGDLEYKPYANYPDWVVAWILSTLSSSVATAQATADTALEASSAAEAQAGTAIEAAEAAYGRGELADTHLTEYKAQDAIGRVWADEVTIEDSASSYGMFTDQRYGYIRSSTDDTAKWKMQMNCAMTKGGTLYILGILIPYGCTVAVYIDDTYISTFDTYYPSLAMNQLFTVSLDADVKGDGLHNIRFEVAAHGAEDGTLIAATKIWFVQNS